MANKILFIVILQQIIWAVLADECGVVPITKWGCDALRRTSVLNTPVKLVVFQHTVTMACHTDRVCESLLKNIRDYHINHLYFTDIGYSFLIGNNGKVYEGAGWTHVGAHTRLYNNKTIGIAFIGDFTYELPSHVALQAAEDLLACGVKQKYLTENYRIVGHRQLTSTNSPGDCLQNHIKTWSHWTYAAESTVI